jgi:hypothetical protein
LAGEIATDEYLVPAIDRAGTFTLPVAVGDRVRVYDRVHDAAHDGKRKMLASNGDALQVLACDERGLYGRNERTGVEGRLEFARLRRDEASGAVWLSTAEASTINVAQGATERAAVLVMPSGSQGIDANKAYTALSRHTHGVAMVANVEAERAAVTQHRPLGERTPVTERDVLANLARNLGRQDQAELASEVMLERRPERGHTLSR